MGQGDGGSMNRWGIGIIAMVSMVILFQNCGKAGFENEEIVGEVDSASLDTRLEKLPFPFDISANQIAHMTCPINGSSGPYFSWKVGAFENPPDVPTATMGIRPSGLQLTQNFIDEWNKVAPTYTEAIRSQKLKETLMNLPSVKNAQLQISFRKTNSPKIDLMAMPSGDDSPTMNFMPAVSSEAIAAAFVRSPGEVLSHFPEAVEFQDRFLETSLVVPSSYGAQDSALRANYDSSFLTLGFLMPAPEGQTATSNELAGPGSDPRFAYGKGYRVRFGVTNPRLRTTQYPPSDSLVQIEEYDLKTGYPVQGTAWDCSMRFKIVRPADRFKPMYRANHFSMINGACPTAPVTSPYCASSQNESFGIHPSYFPNGTCPSNRRFISGQVSHCEEQYYQTCPFEPYTADLNDTNPINREDGLYHPSYPARPAVLHALRRFLPANQWDINVSRRCVVPKFDDNACYSAGAPIYDEFFFPGLEANPSLGMNAGCGVAGQMPCAAYLTVCVRR